MTMTAEVTRTITTVALDTESTQNTPVKKDRVNLDEGENWMITFRKNKLKELGWKGTLLEWSEAMDLLNVNPLDLDPPATSLDEAKERAKTK